VPTKGKQPSRRNRLQRRIDEVLRRLADQPGSDHYSPYVHYPGADPAHAMRHAAEQRGLEGAVEELEQMTATHHPAQLRRAVVSFLAGSEDARKLGLTAFPGREG
jgi:hypothetical protein